MDNLDNTIAAPSIGARRATDQFWAAVDSPAPLGLPELRYSGKTA